MADQIYWPSFFFLLFAGISCAFAVAVVLSPNIVRMAFYLVMSLAATAGLFFLAGADFVGVMQLLIYVGGTLVLLVFGVMLTSQDRFISMHTNRGEMLIATLVGASLLAVLVGAAMSVPAWNAPLTKDQVAAIPLEATATPIGMGLLGLRVDDSSRSGYLLVFEIISVHLLVVLIGAAYLARAQTKKEHGSRMMSLPIASLLTEPVGVSHYLVVGAVLFVCGALCMATKRNAIGVLMGIELVLNGANLNFIAFGSQYLRNDAGTIKLDGQLMSLFVIVLAAAEAAVALAIALNFYNSFNTIDVDQADQLKG